MKQLQEHILPFFTFLVVSLMSDSICCSMIFFVVDYFDIVDIDGGGSDDPDSLVKF